MAFMIPFLRQPALPREAPAIVRAAGMAMDQGDRPVFKAPPLDVKPPIGDVLELTAEIQNRLPLFR